MTRVNIPIRVFIVVNNADLLDSKFFPGGSLAYVEGRPGAAKDGAINVVGAMSGVDVQFILENLVALGLLLGWEIAVGDLVHGALGPAPAFVLLWPALRLAGRT